MYHFWPTGIHLEYLLDGSKTVLGLCFHCFVAVLIITRSATTVKCTPCTNNDPNLLGDLFSSSRVKTIKVKDII